MYSGQEQAIQEWCRDAAKTTSRDWRQNGRYPFFQPITVTAGGGKHGEKLSAFSRDISLTGVGLLHPTKLEPQGVILTISTSGGHQFDVSSEVMWCKPCCEGWYLSGARFEGLTARQSVTLLVDGTVRELKRRWVQRYPFFQPITVTASGGKHGEKLSAFSRDISLTGVGLLHPIKLEAQGVILTISTSGGHQFDVSSEVMWCKPCGRGWYLSGARFSKLDLMELEPYCP